MMLPAAAAWLVYMERANRASAKMLEGVRELLTAEGSVDTAVEIMQTVSALHVRP